MRRNVFLVLVLLILGFMTVSTPASAEDVSGLYLAAGFGWDSGTPGISFVSGSYTPPWVGGAELVASKPYPMVEVWADDNYYGPRIAKTVCEGSRSAVWGPIPSTCQAGCDNVILSFSGGSGDRVTAFVHTLFVDPNLSVCGGREGQVTARFS